MAWDTPIGLGPVTDCHQLSGGGPQTSGSADRRDQEAAAGLKGGAAPCVRVWPFSRRNSVFLTNRVREKVFSARKGSLWAGRGRPGQTGGSVTDREPRGSQEGQGEDRGGRSHNPSLCPQVSSGCLFQGCSLGSGMYQIHTLLPASKAQSQ